MNSTIDLRNFPRATAVLAALLFAFAGRVSPEEHIQAAARAFQQGSQAASRSDWASAEKLFLAAIDIEPTFLGAYRALVDVYLKAGQTASAGAMLARLLQIEPESIQDRLRLGRLLLEGGEPRKALAQFALARRSWPDNADVLEGFARAALACNMPAHARNAAGRGARLFPQDPRFDRLLTAAMSTAPSR